METILDACSVINLANSQLFESIIQLPKRKWVIGQIVYEECNDDENTVIELEKAVSHGQIILLDGSDVDAVLYLDLLDKYNLGDGETECLTYALTHNFYVASDDKKARQAIETEVGSLKVIGSIGLLKEAVNTELISSVEAEMAYVNMKRKGAFLPNLPENFFERGS